MEIVTKFFTLEKCIFSLFLALFSINSGAQFPNNIRISDKNVPNEVSIALNPKDIKQLVVGANHKWVYTSTDGGYHWNIDSLQSSYGVAGDPVILCDTAGAFYYIHLSLPDQGSWLDRIVVQKIDTIGKIWSNGTYTGLNANKDQDKPWAVIDPLSNRIYITWTEFDTYWGAGNLDSSRILFSYSADGGESWSMPVRINQLCGKSIDGDAAVEGAVPTVGINGEVFVTWSGPNNKIYFDKSIDGGQTWLADDIVVSDQPGGWDYEISGLQRCNGMPVIACDRSQSSYRGNIYVNWSDQRNGVTDTDIWFARSLDGGQTWSAPKRVNKDEAGHQQFMSWMCVDDVTGWIYVLYYDRRNYEDDRTDVFIAVSKDGGDNFSEFCISESSFQNNANLFFGDYINIVAHNNTIRPVWTRAELGKNVVMTALIDAIQLSNKIKLPVPFEWDNAWPNPSDGNIYFGFKLKHPTNVNVKLYDNLGKICAILIQDEWRTEGKYIQAIDPQFLHLNSGIYFLHVSTDDRLVHTQRIIVQ